MANHFYKPHQAKFPVLELLMSSFSYSREMTIQVVSGLSIQQLDYNFDSKSNSIGSLLMHIAALEYLYQRLIFDKRYLNLNENEFWHGAFCADLPKRRIRGNSLSFYLDIMNRVREETISKLNDKDDDWLFESGDSVLVSQNNYSNLFHLIEDEISHVGQIKMIKKRI